MPDDTTTRWTQKKDDGPIKDLRSDVSEKIELSRQLSFAAARCKVFEFLLLDLPIERVLEVFCTVIEEFFPERHCAIAVYDPVVGALRRGAAPSLPDEFWKAWDITHAEAADEATTDKRQSPGPTLVRDIATRPGGEDGARLYESLGLRGCWTRPILEPDGRLLGTLSIYSATAREPDSSEASLIESAVETGRVAIRYLETKRNAKEREELYRLVSEATSDAVLLTSAEGAVLYGNRAAEQLFGYSDAEFEEQDLNQLFSQPESPDSEIDIRAGAVSETRVLDATHRSGRSVPVEVRCVEVDRSDNGRRLVIARDVTDRHSKVVQFESEARKLERQIDRRTEKLARSEARNHQLYDLAPDLYVTMNRRGVLTEVNQTTIDVLGYSREEMIGTPIFELLPVESREALPPWLSALEHGRSVINEACTLIKKNGQLVRTTINARVRFDDSGAIEEIWVALRDISHRLALTQSLEESERYAMTGRLAAGIAHEVNNPLQTLLLHMSIVEAALESKFSESDSWEQMKVSVQRIRHVVSSMMDLHRVGRSRVDLVDLNELVCEALKLVESRIQLNGVQLEVNCSRSLPKLCLVPQHVFQIVLNLLLNATDAMGGGGVLEVRTRQLDGNAVFEVKDTAPGIGPEEIEHLDDPLFVSRRAEGSLGLFVTRSLVEDQGGRIEVENRSGKGTLVRVTLPHRARDRRGSSPDQSLCI